jgi:hypothetical protein
MPTFVKTPLLMNVRNYRPGTRNIRTMKMNLKSLFKTFSVELLVYAVLVVAYFFLVLHFLGGWLYHLFKDERSWYAAMALILIVAQGIVLESVTRALLNLIRRNRED